MNSGKHFYSFRSNSISEDSSSSGEDDHIIIGSPKSCPIPVPQGKQDRNALKLSGGSFIPPHLYKKQENFDEFHFEINKRVCKRAF